jgi:hypothetical protein
MVLEQMKKQVPDLFRFTVFEFKNHIKPIVDSIVDKDLKDTFSSSVDEFLLFVSYPAISMSAIIDSNHVFKKITEYASI